MVFRVGPDVAHNSVSLGLQWVVKGESGVTYENLSFAATVCFF